MIEVCTVYTPRPQHPKWMDYLPLLAAQRDSVLRLGMRHTVVSDVDLPGLTTIRAELPQSLMHAIIVGQIARLKLPTDGPLLLVDADCLLLRDPTPAFGEWDLGLTFRENETAPINNGAMYVVNAERACGFLEQALTVCGEHWGGDQEAISAIAAPVPQREVVKLRGGCKVGFLDMRKYAVATKLPRSPHRNKPYVMHFKGAAKAWMVDYAQHCL